MSETIPQYLKIRQYVFGIIANKKIVGGSLKIDTEEELCKNFGVSRITAGKALNQMVAEGLLVRKPRLGTFIRPEVVDKFHLNIDTYMTVGLIISDGMATFLDEYYMAQAEKIFECLKNSGCVVRLISFNGSAEQEAKELGKGKLDGIIWLMPSRKEIPVLRVFKSFNIPVVSTFPRFISDEFDYIAMDYYKCGYAVAKYLLSHGHRRILFININPSDVEAVKKSGCMAAFAEHGVEWHEHLWNCNDNGFTEAEIKSFLKSSGNFSAVNAYKGYVNYVKRELADCKNVQIIHNIFNESAAVREGMPGILQPVAQVGRSAAEMLLEIIKEPNPSGRTRQLLLETTIVEL